MQSPANFITWNLLRSIHIDWKLLLAGNGRGQSLRNRQAHSNCSIPTQRPASRIKGSCPDTCSGTANHLCRRFSNLPERLHRTCGRRVLGSLLPCEPLAFKCSGNPSCYIICFKRGFRVGLLAHNGLVTTFYHQTRWFHNLLPPSSSSSQICPQLIKLCSTAGYALDIFVHDHRKYMIEAFVKNDIAS